MPKISQKYFFGIITAKNLSGELLETLKTYKSALFTRHKTPNICFWRFLCVIGQIHLSFFSPRRAISFILFSFFIFPQKVQFSSPLLSHLFPSFLRFLSLVFPMLSHLFSYPSRHPGTVLTRQYERFPGFSHLFLGSSKKLIRSILRFNR